LPVKWHKPSARHGGQDITTQKVRHMKNEYKKRTQIFLEISYDDTQD
jgi:hypothetical protein